MGGSVFFNRLIWHNKPMGSKVLKKIISPLAKPIAKLTNAIPGGNFIIPAILAATGNPEFIPLFSATNTIGNGGSLGQAALSAGGSYLGGKFGSNIFGDLGSVGQGLTNTFGNVAGNTIASGIGGLADASISSGLGSFAGNSVADSVSGASMLGAKNNSPISTVAAFKPQRSGEQTLPGSLQGFGSLNPDQQATNIANQGVFGGGLGAQEEDYFTNLVNRQLVDDSGKVGDMGSLAPIENSYLQQLGLSGYGNTNDLLEAISKRKRAA